MLAPLALCLLSLAALVAGAELLTRSGSGLAARLGISPLIIGLTIVALGTSTPELAVGIEAALHGNGPLAVGNIAGTNTVNILLILGLSAMIKPLTLRPQTLYMDLPAMILAALLFWAVSQDGTLSRGDGAVLVLAGAVYTALIVGAARREIHAGRIRIDNAPASSPGAPRGGGSAPRQAAGLLAGIAVIVVAADFLVDGTVTLARLWGVSDAFIGLTIVAIGTSAPELVTAIVSSFRGERDIAIGNLLGSSVYNIVFIMGATSLVPPNGIAVSPELIHIDIPVMTAAALLCVPAFLSGRAITRLEGAGFVLAYGVYLACLIILRT